MIGPGCCAVDHQRGAVDGLCKGCLRTYNKMKKGEKETEREQELLERLEKIEWRDKNRAELKAQIAKVALKRWPLQIRRRQAAAAKQNNMKSEGEKKKTTFIRPKGTAATWMGASGALAINTARMDASRKQKIAKLQDKFSTRVVAARAKPKPTTTHARERLRARKAAADATLFLKQTKEKKKKKRAAAGAAAVALIKKKKMEKEQKDMMEMEEKKKVEQLLMEAEEAAADALVMLKRY